MTNLKRKILITGAAGRIGRHLTDDFAGRYDLVLADVDEASDIKNFPFTQADLSDIDAARRLCQGIDTVVHLAADPNTEAPWESLLPNNIVAVYNIFQAAHEARCRRVIFASSINAVSGYPKDVQVRTSMPVRPPNLYGATKAWGEAVACYYADQKDLSAICLRFGWVQDPAEHEGIPFDHPLLDSLLSYRDLAQLVAKSIDAPDDLRFAIFHGVSNNHWKRLDITDARQQLGYDPEDDAFDLLDSS